MRGYICMYTRHRIYTCIQFMCICMIQGIIYLHVYKASYICMYTRHHISACIQGITSKEMDANVDSGTNKYKYKYKHTHTNTLCVHVYAYMCTCRHTCVCMDILQTSMHAAHGHVPSVSTIYRAPRTKKSPTHSVITYERQAQMMIKTLADTHMSTSCRKRKPKIQRKQARWA
jgi:hypothetical protein